MEASPSPSWPAAAGGWGMWEKSWGLSGERSGRASNEPQTRPVEPSSSALEFSYHSWSSNSATVVTDSSLSANIYQEEGARMMGINTGKCLGWIEGWQSVAQTLLRVQPLQSRLIFVFINKNPISILAISLLTMRLWQTSQVCRTMERKFADLLLIQRKSQPCLCKYCDQAGGAAGGWWVGCHTVAAASNHNY